jgi:hypothetical protein
MCKAFELNGIYRFAGISGELVVAPVDRADMEVDYAISSNISYVPAIVNPDTTHNFTSRLLRNR